MKVLVVHGSLGSPFENWFPWLHRELEEEGVVCHIPSFPTPDGQSFDKWRELLDYYRAVGVFTSETIAIGHSAGAVFLVKYLIEAQFSIPGLITVAGYNNFYANNLFMDKLNASLYTQRTREISHLAQERVAFFSESDPFIPLAHLASFAEELQASKHSVPGGGHFNSASGYREFPDLLKAVLQLKEGLTR